RDLAKPHTVEIVWEGPAPRAADGIVLTGSDLKASNTFEAPTRVVPQKAEKPTSSGARTTLELPARSYTVVQWAS
ncbi:MAG TPA: alpha-L-arabinofuranosidase C-terminal domain-containing protein, partial [Candidatus Acidoferrum sp.]